MDNKINTLGTDIFNILNNTSIFNINIFSNNN